MIVVGAGMAGLLAAAMLRNDCDRILEAQDALPNNHSAVLRFRSSVVGDTLNIPFKKVSVLKAVVTGSNPVADQFRYSFKTNGSYSLRSALSARGQLEERWVAPPDLIDRMARRVSAPIEFGVNFEAAFSGDPIISTIPMPSLMRMLDWKDVPAFDHVHGFNINLTLLDTDAYVSLYVPSPEYDFSRLSITGDRLTIEVQKPNWSYDEVEELAAEVGRNPTEMICDAFSLLGLDEVSNDPGGANVAPARYAKILPTDDQTRKRFILWASEKHRIYSLGRFATWRPGLLLDDLVKDVRVILDIQRNGSYAYRK